jgi:hypothetical protein
VVSLVNVASEACATAGYFGVSAYDPSGKLLASQDVRDSAFGGPADEVTVPPGGSMHFTVGFADDVIAEGGTSCSSTVGALHLIPPNTSDEVQVATPVPSGGYPSLCSSQILVGPVAMGAGPGS